MFYQNTCEHCDKAKPEWIKAAETLRGLVKVGMVNIADESDLTAEY